jgi:hypothetical protein
MAMAHNFAKPILILPHLFSAYSKYDFYVLPRNIPFAHSRFDYKIMCFYFFFIRLISPGNGQNGTQASLAR